MADKRISDLNELASAQLDPPVDVLAIADVSAAETKKITAANLVGRALGTLPPNSISGDVILDGSISGIKLEENSVTSRELAPNSVDTIHVIDGAITNDKLAGGITGDKLEDGSIGSQQLADNAVNGAVHIQDRSIPAIKLEENTLTAAEIAPDAIGSSELADGAVDTDALQDDAISTPKYKDLSVTNEKLADGIDGAKLIDGSVTANKLSGGIDGGQLNEVPLTKLPDAPSNTVLAGPTSGAAASPVYRRLVSADLPVATANDIGGASVPASGGLTVTNGAVSIGNSVVPGGYPFVTYNSHGLITSGRDLVGTDLPPATTNSLGGIIVGDGLSVTGNGTLSQSLTGVVAGTYPKVTVDERGNVTAGLPLSASDIPDLDASQITTGQFGEAQIADRSIFRRHLADYAIAYIQEAQPPTVDVPISQLWLQESTAGLHMWNGNSWMPISIGRLSQENLRYCGIVDASTGLVSGVTQYGSAAGYNVGDALKPASDEQTGIYFVIEVAGNQIPQVPGTAFDAGDWVLCNGAAAGWIRIDTVHGGGGGGGGATRLGELLDVTLTSTAEGALIQYQANGQWTNVNVLDAGDY